MSVRSALEELDLSAVLAAYLEQSEKHGHTAETDADRPLHYFRVELIRRAQDLDVVLPGDRQRLDVGYLRAAALAAFALAAMRRIRREQATCNTAELEERCRHLSKVKVQDPSSPYASWICTDCKERISERDLMRIPR